MDAETKKALIAQKKAEIEKLKKELAELETPPAVNCYFCRELVSYYEVKWVDGNPCDATYAEVCGKCLAKRKL